jgi:hypothetical protein
MLHTKLQFIWPRRRLKCEKLTDEGRPVNKDGHQRQFLFLIGQFLKKIFSSKTARPNELKLCRNHLVEVLYKECSFRSDSFTNMAPKAILVSDWSISKNSPSLKLLGQMNRHLVGSIYGRSSIKIVHFVLIC